MASVTLTKITIQGNTVRIRFGKREREFSSLQAVRDFVKDAVTPDTLEAIFLALALSRQPALGNPAALEGHTVTVDFSLNNWGTVS